MANFADLRPGARIYNVNDERGTFTCFAIKTGKRHRLYGITARHVLPTGSLCYLGDFMDSNRILIGGPAKPAAALDVTRFRIDEQLKSNLTPANFRPVGYAADITDVWDPRTIRHKVDHARTARDEEALRAKLMQVKHFGATTLVPPAPGGIVGEVAKWTNAPTTRVQRTAIAPGDSGGPVIDANKNRWVGFVSCGTMAGPSTEGGIVLLQEAFDALGLALASWHNRGHWQTP